MTKTYVVRDEIYEYPDTGDSNYGEEATGWAGAITEVAAEVSGPGDIATTEVQLIGSIVLGRTEGPVTNLLFDTSFVQSLSITGHLTRTFTDATPTRVEYVDIKGAFNGTEIVFSPDYSGDDTEVEFDTTGGQFTFSYLNETNTDTVTFKFSASAKIDESFFP